MKPRVLIIEDSADMCLAYSMALDRDYDIKFSLNIQEIESIVKDFDIVVSDYEMGLDFQQVVLACSNASVPLIAVTGCGMKVHDVQFNKPVSKADLVAGIERHRRKAA
jgi:DNA-binding NtrC family response regulator